MLRCVPLFGQRNNGYKEVVLRGEKKTYHGKCRSGLRFGGPPVAINLAALHPDPGARAPGLVTRIRLPSGTARKASGYRAASEMAVVATPLITIRPDRPYDQEIKSLLMLEIMASQHVSSRL